MLSLLRLPYPVYIYAAPFTDTELAQAIRERSLNRLPTRLLVHRAETEQPDSYINYFIVAGAVLPIQVRHLPQKAPSESILVVYVPRYGRVYKNGHPLGNAEATRWRVWFSRAWRAAKRTSHLDYFGRWAPNLTPSPSSSGSP